MLPFGGRIASGWQTAPLSTRLMCDGYLLESPCIGSPGMEELRWTMPVGPGEALRLRSTVIEQTHSQKDASRGSAKCRWEMINRNDEVVCWMTGPQYFLRSKPAQ